MNPSGFADWKQMKLERLKNIEQYVVIHGFSSLEELSKQFNISMSTVRRDVSYLVRNSRFEKVYGGVAVHDCPGNSAPCPGKSAGCADTGIAEIAAGLVGENMSVFLDSGSTILSIIPFLAKKKKTTVISHNLNVLCEAAKYPSLNVIALGGIYDWDSSSFISLKTLQELSKMSIDVAFLSASGVSLKHGMSSNSFSEIEIKKTVVKCNKDLILWIEQSAFGRDALLAFGDYNDINVIITNKTPPNEFVSANETQKIRLLIP